MIDLDELHRRVPIADGHADSLMWNRDLNQASERGHVDFPRLREAGVKIQAFTIVTRGLPLVDGFELLMRKEGWPSAARAGEWARCLWQVGNLERYCAESRGVAAVTGARAALTDNLAAGRLSAIIGIEGAHAIEGRVDRVAELARRGVRFMSLTHLSNNELGGTSTPLMGNRPLTPLGHEVLDAMGQHGMAIDVAHASPAMLPSLLAHPAARPFCSHAGVRGATPLWRNLDDATLKAIADKGGVVGIIFAPQFLGGRRLDDVARHVEHALDVMGEDGVALGSDFDGLIPLPQGMRDVRDLRRLTEVLVARRLPVRVVEKVLGHNFRRFWGEVLA
ncbi:MAG: membrane dipeptidase [Myxococcaceae bacterium]|nr:membrane dipeptidase [Myxococcaceae bacterium]MCA3014586.1 membrane dipeptidase [Myxococcaceae bacterium]